ncbi:MAG: sodium-dependent transporter, partial [Oscillospiraceae bacterium]|nr:sodium-dependent transporter [Oscillospiraceae bacterium]
MKEKKEGRGQFTSSFGFIMAAAGGAIGLGNLWKFPYVAGAAGGGFFLLFSLVFAVLLGLPLMLAEMSIGRSTRLNAIGAFEKLGGRWKFVGVLDVLSAFLVLSYYSVVGGWVLKYVFAYAQGENLSDAAAYFDAFHTQTAAPLWWHLAFMAFCVLVVAAGVAKGIELAGKWLLPLLFVLLLVVLARSVTLPGAGEGLAFLFLPRAETFTFESAALAMGQVLFSLSLGLGVAVTYGSYLRRDADLLRDASAVVGLDTLMAFLSGAIILPV